MILVEVACSNKNTCLNGAATNNIYIRSIYARKLLSGILVLASFILKMLILESLMMKVLVLGMFMLLSIQKSKYNLLESLKYELINRKSE